LSKLCMIGGGEVVVVRGGSVLTLTASDPVAHWLHRTANLQMLHFIYYSTNIRTEYFKHAAHSPFFSLQNAVYFIMLPFLVPVLFTFYIQSGLKFKKNSGAKGLRFLRHWYRPEAISRFETQPMSYLVRNRDPFQG
jgi:cytochrome bd-type quinol oxidase subunit 2